MNIAVWVVQVVLALVYLGAGLTKATQPKEKLQEKMAWAEDFSPGTIRFIGVVEALGAIGLILPAVTGILPWLTPLAATGLAVVQLLAWEHRDLAEMFAGVAPAPGGAFRQAEFEQTEWGPRLTSASTWAGVRLESEQQVGWSTLVTTVVEHLEVGGEAADDEPLRHRRGRYGR